MEIYKSTQPLKDETTGKYFYPMICVDQIYPIGSIYMSVNNVNPAALFGGTWERIKDTFLLSAGDIYNAGEIGGEATHTLTTDEMPSHAHNIYARVSKNQSGSTSPVISGVEHWWTAPEPLMGFTDAQGGSQPHNNMPPYLTVYMWQRIS